MSASRSFDAGTSTCVTAMEAGAVDDGPGGGAPKSISGSSLIVGAGAGFGAAAAAADARWGFAGAGGTGFGAAGGGGASLPSDENSNGCGSKFDGAGAWTGFGADGGGTVAFTVGSGSVLKSNG